MLARICFFVFLLAGSLNLSQAGQWRGNIIPEYRYFPNPGQVPYDYQNNFSLSGEVEFYTALPYAGQSLTIKPFARIDQHDDERSHFDMRELSWMKSADRYEIQAGISKVFWGVTESVHLVDIINQTDAVENTDGEDKLGQAMFKLSGFYDWGTVDFFVLPWFRERDFPGAEGRPALPIIIDPDTVLYESKDEDQHIDYALRWSHSIGLLDIGLSQFHGTNRTPILLPKSELFGNRPIFQAFYEIIDQTGIDAQVTTEAWLWKLESIHRRSVRQSFTAAAAGFEYTFVGVFDSAANIGMIAEYLYDDRGVNSGEPFQDDLMLGFRLTLNDENSTEMLLGSIRDLEFNTTTFRIETSRRIGEHYRISLEANFYENITNDPFFSGIQDEEFVMLELGYYF